MNNTILLTGGTGFLGSHVLRSLLDFNYNVIVIIRESSNLHRIESFQNKIKLFCLNENYENIDELFLNNKIDVIIHTATEYGRNCPMSSILQTNLIFPVKLIEEGIKNNLKLFINSDTFFGKPIYKDSVYLNEYTTSKKYFLEYLFNSKDKVKIANMRLEHVFGEFDSENKFVTNVLHQLIKGGKDVLLTEGIQKRDFIYVHDVVDAYLKVINNINQINNFTEFEVGRGESTSVRRFVETLLKISESKSELKFGALPTRKAEISDSVANLTELEKIGWKPNYKLTTAISKMVEIERTNIN